MNITYTVNKMSTKSKQNKPPIQKSKNLHK